MHAIKQIWVRLKDINPILPFALTLCLILGISSGIYGSVQLVRYIVKRYTHKEVPPPIVEKKEEIKPTGYYPMQISPNPKEDWREVLLRLGQNEARVDSISSGFKENKDIGSLQSTDRLSLFSVVEDGSLDSLELIRKTGQVFRGYRTKSGWLIQEIKGEEGVAEVALVCTLKTRLEPMLKEKYNNPVLIKQAIQLWSRAIGTKKCREKDAVFSFLISEKRLPGGRTTFNQLWWSRAQIGDKAYTIGFFPTSMHKDTTSTEEIDSMPSLPEEPGEGLFYTSDGRSLHRIFLGIPLRYQRISSKYTKSRYHPILKRNRPHLAIDFVAKKGTPVRATSAGSIVIAGRHGGSGNLVAIKHLPGVFSYYGHLSKITKGIKTGVSVRAGRIIGYVGSTGLSTGPHLDYRVRINGKFLNPLKNRLIAFPALSTSELARWTYLMYNYEKRFEGLTSNEPLEKVASK